MKVLITGAAGFIGGAISKHLIKHGIEVIAFDQKQPAIEGLSKIIQMDIGVDSPGARIADEIGSCDAIVHAAAVINMGFDNPDVIITNCLGTQQLLRSAEILEARCFVYLSSVPVIGVPKKLPITEDHQQSLLLRIMHRNCLESTWSGSHQGRIWPGQYCV